MIHRYVVETATPTLCKLVSLSEAFTPNGRTHAQAVRTLNVKKVDENTCELVSSMTVHPTAEFMDFIGQDKIKFKDAAGARQHVEGEHNRRETPLMAASIERMVLGQANLPEALARHKLARFTARKAAFTQGSTMKKPTPRI